MKVIIFLLYFGTAFAYYDENNSSPKNHFDPIRPNYEIQTPMKANQGIFFHPATFLPRFEIDNIHEQVLNSQRDKREAAGALHIVTNHAQPIHADVKPDSTATDVTEKVTAPEDTFYELKSLRKSWPFPSKLELARSISRITTLAVLVVSAIVEFFPLLKRSRWMEVEDGIHPSGSSFYTALFVTVTTAAKLWHAIDINRTPIHILTPKNIVRILDKKAGDIELIIHIDY